jgi:uncharacterized protein
MMNSKIKDFIGVIAGVGIIGFVLIAWMYVDAFSKSIEPSSFRSFAVSAEGDIVTIPDVAQFTFSVITQGGANIASLQQDNTEKTNKAINFAKAQGVEDKDIKTQNFSLQPRYQHFSCPRSFSGEAEPCPPSEIVGYTINQTVQVKVREQNFVNIGTIVSGVVDNGANSVSQLVFTIDDRDKSESDARAEAIEKAKEKAKAVAKAGGFKIGRLLSIQESGSPFYPAYRQAFDAGFGGAAAESAPAPSIEPGSQEVKVNVTLVYEIQ